MIGAESSEDTIKIIISVFITRILKEKGEVHLDTLDAIKMSSDLKKDLENEVKNELAIGYPPDPSLEEKLVDHIKVFILSSL